MMADSHDMGADLPAEDRVFAAALEALHPAPTPLFRGALARRIAGLDPGYGHRPEHLWAKSTAMTAVGVVLVLIAALIATGVI